MTITLISQEQSDRIREIFKGHDLLFLQNEGYQYVDKSQFSEEDKKAFNEVTEILKGSIKGFSEFNNFRLYGESNRLQLRFQYNWDADRLEGGYFIGVGYILLDELLKGFEENEDNK